MKAILNTRLYISLFVWLSLFAFSCQNSSPEQEKKEGEITISGKVDNVKEGSTIQVSQVQRTGSPQLIKETKPDSDGNYSLNIPYDKPGYYVLDFFKAQTQVLVIEKAEDIEVNADGSSPYGNIEIKGSEGSLLFNEVQELQQNLEKEGQAFQQQLYTMQNEDSALIQFEAFMGMQKDKVKSFINKAKPSIVVFLAMQMLDLEEDLEFAEKIGNEMQAAHPDLDLVQDFVESIAVIKATSVGQAAPDFTLSTPDGKEVSLSDFKGKYLLVDFWASWCGPCRAENPNVVNVYKDFQPKGFEILGVSLDKNKPDWESAIEADGLTWTQVSDLKHWESKVVGLYNITGIPFTILLDKEGKIIGKNLRGESMREMLQEVMP